MATSQHGILVRESTACGVPDADNTAEARLASTSQCAVQRCRTVQLIDSCNASSECIRFQHHTYESWCEMTMSWYPH